MNCTPHRLRVVPHPLTALPQVDFPLLLFCLQPLSYHPARTESYVKMYSENKETQDYKTQQLIST